MIASCRKDSDLNRSSLLHEFLENPGIVGHNELIACAGGGENSGVGSEEFPVEVFMYMEENWRNVKIYETQSIDEDPNDLGNFIETDRYFTLILDGFMSKFSLESTAEKWVRVSYEVGDTLWYCKAIRLKYSTNPTKSAANFLSIDDSIETEPLFSWTELANPQNIIYFSLIRDLNNNIQSATYTTEDTFQFYNTENVILNLTPSDASLTLNSGQTYLYFLMGVSQDNWINDFYETSFDA